MIPIYGRVLSAIEKVLQDLVEEYQGIGKSLQDLVEGQKRNIAQLARIGASVLRRIYRVVMRRTKKKTKTMRRGLRIGPKEVRER